MSDLSRLFQPFEEEEEEEELGYPSLASLVGGPTGPEAEPQERNFLDRVLAPFEAPQQFLFKLTTEIGDDGFQLGDVGRAASHGARFANPFSDVERVDPEEVRKTFFGDKEMSKFWRGATNLGISLLYDPLLIAPLAKSLRLVDAGSDALRTLEKATNPAGALIGATASATGRALKPVAARMNESNWGNRIQQWLVDRYAGLPQNMRNAIDRLDQGVMKWRNEAHQILKKAEKLGGSDAQRLMAETLENEAVWLARSGVDTADSVLGEASKIDRRLEEMGVSGDIFWDVYDRARRLDDEIGEGLVRSGVIGKEEFEELRGKHLRRMFLATERPQDFINRIEALDVPSTERFSVGQLKRGLNEIRKELDADILSAPKNQDRLFDLGESLFGGNKYFRDGERTRFNVNAFANDLDEWLGANSAKSAEEVFAHVQDEMLQGTQLPGEFWKKIGDHISGAYVHVEGSKEWADKLRQWHYTPGFNWFTVNERLKVVSKRKDLAPEIREALGEVLDFGPRIAAQASDAGRLLETRQFLDNVGNIVRDPDDPTKIISRGGNKIAYTLEQAEESGLKNLVKIQGQHLGPLDGMWVKPAIARTLKHMDGVSNIGNPSRKAWDSVGEFIKRRIGEFKVFKVILDPAAQVRNFIGNAVLMDMAGISPLHFGRMNKAVMELRDFGKTGNLGKYLQLAEDAGVTMFQHTFAREELQVIARHMGDDLAGDPRKTLNALQRVYAGMQETYGKTAGYMGNLFEFEEKMFKLATFIGKYEELKAPLIRRGKSLTPEMQKSLAAQAGELAERALFNYADIPHLAKFARDYGVIPFITFPLKATSFVGKTLVEHPYRILKYNRTVEGTNEIVNDIAGSDRDVAEEIAALPEHARRNLVLRMPFDDDGGRAQFLDLSYFLPWFVVQDLAQSIASGGEDDGILPRDGMFTPPLLAAIDAIRHNKDSLGREIVTKDMSTTEKFFRVGDFFYKLWLPADAPGGSRASSIGRAMQAVARNSPEQINWLDALGTGFSLGTTNDRALGRSGFMPTSQAQVGTGGELGAVLGGLGGLFALNTIASDTPQQLRNAQGKAAASTTEIHRQMARVRSNLNLSPADRATRIQRLIKQLRKANEELSETSSAMF